MEKFSARLKELRLASKLTQNELACKLFIKQQSYLRYELGTGEPSLDTLVALAKIFNVSIDYLLGNDDDI